MTATDYVKVTTGQADKLFLEHYNCEKAFVAAIEKPRSNLVPKNKTGDFISTVQKTNAFKKGPGEYKPLNENFFKTDARSI